MDRYATFAAGFLFLRQPSSPVPANAELEPQTALVHAGTLRSSFGETLKAGDVADAGLHLRKREIGRSALQGRTAGLHLSRYSNPTVDMFEKRMCALEGAEDARATASGMAAVTAALLCSARAGDHIVAARALFGSCRWVIETLMPKYGIEATLVDGPEPEEWEKAVRHEYQAVLPGEPPTDRTLRGDRHRLRRQLRQFDWRAPRRRQCVCNAAAAKAARVRRARSSFASATKHIDGRAGHCLGGVILRRDYRGSTEPARLFPAYQPSLSPFNAWTLLKGFETLPVRVRQQTESAAKIASSLPDKARWRASSGQAGPSAGRHHRQADDRWVDPDLLRPQGRQESGVRFRKTRWRSSASPIISAIQEPDHAPGDDDPQEPHRRGACGAWHRTGNAARLDRPGGTSKT